MCVCVYCALAHSLLFTHTHAHSYVRYFEFIVFNSFWVSLAAATAASASSSSLTITKTHSNTHAHRRSTHSERARTHTHVHYSTCMYTRFMAFCKCICICMSTCTCVWLLTFHYFCCCCWWLLLLLAREGKPKGKKSIHTARKHFGRITFQIAQNLRIIESVIEFSLLKQQHYSPCFGRARSVSHSRTRTHESHHNRQNFHTFSHEPENERLLNVRVVQRVLVD